MEQSIFTGEAMLIHDLDTPAVVCDLDKLERNMQAMAVHYR
jgi:D-serine deaminase-like pyridoxal phosphate-dependent protein